MGHASFIYILYMDITGFTMQRVLYSEVFRLSAGSRWSLLVLMVETPIQRIVLTVCLVHCIQF